MSNDFSDNCAALKEIYLDQIENESADQHGIFLLFSEVEGDDEALDAFEAHFGDPECIAEGLYVFLEDNILSGNPTLFSIFKDVVDTLSKEYSIQSVDDLDFSGGDGSDTIH